MFHVILLRASILALSFISQTIGQSVAQPAATASIFASNQYLEQVECVQNCIWHHGASNDVVDFVGCGSPFLNGCICNPSEASSASSFLTSCVLANCTSNSNDVTSAVSVYSVYCAGDATVPTTTSESSVSSSTNAATPGSGVSTTSNPTTTPTPSTAFSPKSSSSSGLSAGDIAAIISCPLAVLGLMATLYKKEFRHWLGGVFCCDQCGREQT